MTMNQLSSLASVYLRTMGFKKNSNSWSRKVNDFWQIVILTRDYSWGARYSFSFGVLYDPSCVYINPPKERNCHIRCGCQKLLGHQGDYFRYEIMDLSIAIDDQNRETWINKCLDEAMIFFEKSNCRESVVYWYGNGYYKNALFHNDLRNIFELG